MPTTNKIKRFKPGPTISASHLNTVVDRMNRPSPIGVSGLQQTTLPGNQVAYSRGPAAHIRFTELGQDMDKNDGGKYSFLLHHVVQGSDPSETTQGFKTGGTTPETQAVRFKPIHDGQESVYLTGERHAMLYLANAAGSIPMPGIQMHLGQCNEASPNFLIPSHGTGSFDIRREGFDNAATETHGVALDDGAISVDAFDALGLGCDSGIELDR